MSKLRHLLIILLLGLLPFHAFLITWIKSRLPSLSLIAGWKEALVVLIIGVCVIEIWEKRKKVKVDRLDVAVLLYIGVSLIWAIVQRETITQWIFGFRVDVLPFVLFIALRHVVWDQTAILYKVMMGTGAAVIIFGLLQALILPREFLTYFGYGTAQGMLQPDSAITGCQYLEHTPKVCRAISTFGGPTRYGVYLLVLAGVVLPYIRNKRAIFSAMSVFIIASIILTYSRSVWIAAAAMVLIGSFFFATKRLRWVMAGMLTAGVVVLIVAGYMVKDLDQHQSLLRSILVRASSTGAHITYIQDGVKVLAENPMGIGLGKVGPASLRFEPFLTENWFLQIAIEMGVAGLLIFLWILFEMALGLYKKKTPVHWGVLLTLIGICITGLFTHSFEESAATLLLVTAAAMLIFAGGVDAAKSSSRSPLHLQ